MLILIPISSELLAKIKIEIDYDNCDSIISWIISCLPNALWCMALPIFQLELCDGGFTEKIIFVLSIARPFTLETTQWFGIMPGTFDWLDVLTQFINPNNSNIMSNYIRNAGADLRLVMDVE